MTFTGIVASLLLFLCAIYIVTFPFVLLNIVSKPPLFVKSKKFNEKFGTLTEDVFKRKTMYQRSYYVLFVFYRVILTGVLVYQYYNPFYQILIISVMQIGMIAYMIKLRPFKSELQQVIGVTDEFTLIFGMILLYWLFKNQYNIQKSQQIGLIIVGVVVLSICKNMGVIFYITITNAYTKIKKMIQKKLKIKDKMRRHRRLERRKQRKQIKEEQEMKEFEDRLNKKSPQKDLSIPQIKESEFIKNNVEVQQTVPEVQVVPEPQVSFEKVLILIQNNLPYFKFLQNFIKSCLK